MVKGPWWGPVEPTLNTTRSHYLVFISDLSPHRRGVGRLIPVYGAIPVNRQWPLTHAPAVAFWSVVSGSTGFLGG